MNEQREAGGRAWQMAKAGSMDRLLKVETTIAEPDDSSVLVAVKAIGLNFADIFAMLGIYSATPKGTFIPGLEFSGEILRVGKNVTKFKTGDRVMGVTRFGAYTTHIIQSPDYLSPIPKGWSFEEGAAYLVQALTAYYSLFSLGGIQKGYKILIHSAAGGVGILANRIAKKMDAYTVGTIGSAAKRELLMKEGYDEVLVRDESFGTKLEATAKERPFNMVLECIGGKVLDMSYKAMAAQGRMIIYGSAHFAETGSKLNPIKLALKFLRRPKIDPLKLISDNKSVMGFNLIWLYEKKEILQYSLAELEKLEIGPPMVGHTFDFGDMKEAIALFQSGKTTGKVVITIA
ncbi:MAG: zinc-binding dehydrogenase [Imperialibacter sp.]|uniref:zinc-binding dehydrogenase n=1 Tax=Imperialibacter sp. TaxID=2038411 RepID=UPI0032EEBBFD